MISDSLLQSPLKSRLKEKMKPLRKEIKVFKEVMKTKGSKWKVTGINKERNTVSLLQSPLKIRL